MASAAQDAAEILHDLGYVRPSPIRNGGPTLMELARLLRNEDRQRREMERFIMGLSTSRIGAMHIDVLAYQSKIAKRRKAK